MNDRDIGRLRLRAQGVVPPGHGGVRVRLEAIGPVQAQDERAALRAIGLRVAGATEADVRAAVSDGSIVRTWPMRGTLHFLAAGDVRWMLRLLAPRVLAGARHRWRALELSEADFSRAADVLTRVLAGGGRLSRSEVFARWRDAGIATGGQRGIHLVARLAMDRLICFGPPDGKHPTFVLLDEWIPPTRDPTGDEALAMLATRYFRTRGPATVRDFAWWSGLRLTDARAAVALAAPALRREPSDGGDRWMSPDLPDRIRPSRTVHLLPAFDEFLLAYTDRRAVLDPAQAGFVVPHKNGMFLPVVVRDGIVAGTWRHTVGNDGLRVAAALFDSSRDGGSAIRPAAAAFARFHGLHLAAAE